TVWYNRRIINGEVALSTNLAANRSPPWYSNARRTSPSPLAAPVAPLDYSHDVARSAVCPLAGAGGRAVPAHSAPIGDRHARRRGLVRDCPLWHARDAAALHAQRAWTLRLSGDQRAYIRCGRGQTWRLVLQPGRRQPPGCSRRSPLLPFALFRCAN